MDKNKIPLYSCIAIFGIVGIYLTFIAGNMNKYDSETRAYKIDYNESYDIDYGTTYYPIYYFKVNGKNYECKSKTSNSTIPKESKNKVYYDSTNPKKCKTEYEKSTNRTCGIICLIVTAIIIILAIKKPSTNENNIKQTNNNPTSTIDKEKAEVALEKFLLIYKRIILGIVIFILFVINLFFIPILRQTIISKDFIKTTAVLVNKKEDTKDNIFDDYIYTFKDKQGNEQEIIISFSKNEIPEDTVNLKYNKNNPKEFYNENEIMNKSELIWYIVRIVVMILLIILFFNKKLLSKIHISVKKE